MVSQERLKLTREVRLSATSDQTGQSLLEITISIGIAIVVVAAVTITTINGLKNSQFSQNQVQATKLAQQGLENIKAIKHRNCPVKLLPDPLNPANHRYWTTDTGQTLIWNDSDFAFPNDNRTFRLSLSPCEMVEDSTVQQLGTIFSRTIKINNGDGANQKKVTSRVNWSDFSGTHQSELITILTNY